MSARDPKTGRFPPRDAPARGAGIGGPARPHPDTRPLRPFSADYQPSPEAKSAGQAERRRRLARIAEIHDRAAEALLARIADDETRANDLNAIVRDTGNRLWGAPTQEVSGPDGGPIENEVTVKITYEE